MSSSSSSSSTSPSFTAHLKIDSQKRTSPLRGFAEFFFVCVRVCVVEFTEFFFSNRVSLLSSNRVCDEATNASHVTTNRLKRASPISDSFFKKIIPRTDYSPSLTIGPRPAHHHHIHHRPTRPSKSSNGAIGLGAFHGVLALRAERFSSVAFLFISIFILVLLCTLWTLLPLFDLSHYCSFLLSVVFVVLFHSLTLFRHKGD